MSLFKNWERVFQKVILSSLLGMLLILYSTADYASKPTFLLTPTTTTRVALATNQTITIIYQVTNQTNKIRTLTIQPISGAEQITTGSGVCPNPFLLTPGSSCTLVLQFAGSPSAKTVVGGPVVCKTKSSSDNSPDPFLCSQPIIKDQLFIARTLPKTQLSITPSSLMLTAGSSSSSETIKVTNNSLRTINHIAANLSGTDLNGTVTQEFSQCSSLASGASCYLIFTPGSIDVSTTSFPIQGDNSLAIAATITVNDPGAPSLSAMNSPLLVSAGTTSNLVVKNTSTASAYNVTAYPLPQALTDLRVTTPLVACGGPIAQGETCSIPINATMTSTAAPSTEILVQAANVVNTATAVTGASVGINGTVTLSLSPSSLVIYADGNTSGSMTITNTGSLTANNVQANFAGTALYGNVSATTCSSISPQGGTCVMTFTASTTSVPATEFPISSSSPEQTVTGTITLVAPRIYYSYASSSAPLISVCDVNPISGIDSQCSNVLDDLTSINAPRGMAINSSSTYLYIANTAKVNNALDYSITKCTINASSGALSDCAVLSDPSFNYPIGVYINDAGTYAYVANRLGNQISICPILSNNGSFSSPCTSFTPGLANFDGATNIVMNSAQNRAYITYLGTPLPEGYIAQCDVSEGGSTLSNCSTTLVNDTINPNGTQLYGLAINPTGTILYTGDFVNPLFFQCYLDDSGLISSCSNTYSTDDLRLSGLAMNTTGEFLYTTNIDIDATYLCTVTNDVITNCSNSHASLGYQAGVALLND